MDKTVQPTKVLFIGGVFAKENEAEVISHAKKSVEFSANIMQLKLIEGLKKVADTAVLSAPFIGHFPNQCSVFYFNGFSETQDLCNYVKFNNVWGFRNISRAHALKRQLHDFIRSDSGRKLIVVFSAHDPFLAAAAYAKKCDPNIRICLVAPDLPQFMNLEEKRGQLYDFFKRIDIQSIQKHILSVDSAVILTRYMADALRLNDRPCLIAEGVVDELPECVEAPAKKADSTVNIVYAGKLYFRFGLKNLLDAFSAMPENSYRLILCGNGDAVDDIKKYAEKDKRIIYTGQISPEAVKQYITNATVLVNPRMNDGVYTRYSFPSKNIEYLLSGKPLVAYMLDGMPECYRQFIYTIDPTNEPVIALKDALYEAIHAPADEIIRRYLDFSRYVSEGLLASSIARKIVQISFNQE